VAGKLNIQDYCFNYISFAEFPPPHTLPVVIKNIQSDGTILLSSIPSFGSFSDNLQMLDITPEKTLVGYATKQVDYGIMIMLAPNACTLIQAPSTILHSVVRVSISIVNQERNKVKARFIGISDLKPPFVDGFEEYVTEDLPDWVDLDEFVAENRPGSKAKTSCCEQITETGRDLEPPSFELESTDSLFRTITDYREIITFEKIPFKKKLEQGIERGIITQEHTDIARAVDTLKWTTSHHLAQFMYLRTAKLFSKAQLLRKLNTLVEYGVLRRCWFSSSDNTDKRTPWIYCRGSEFYKISPFLSHHSYIPQSGLDAPDVKRRLAANQLTIGCLLAFPGIELLPNHKHEATGSKPLFSRYVLRMPNGVSLYPGSIRATTDDEEKAFRKLENYNNVLGEHDIVLLTCENAEHLARIQTKLCKHQYAFHLRLITDLESYDIKQLTELTTISNAHPTTSASVKHSSLFGFLTKLGIPGII
jgi:hypothetical protein